MSIVITVAVLVLVLTALVIVLAGLGNKKSSVKGSPSLANRVEETKRKLENL